MWQTYSPKKRKYDHFSVAVKVLEIWLTVFVADLNRVQDNVKLEKHLIAELVLGFSFYWVTEKKHIKNVIAVLLLTMSNSHCS